MYSSWDKDILTDDGCVTARDTFTIKAQVGGAVDDNPRKQAGSPLVKGMTYYVLCHVDYCTRRRVYKQMQSFSRTVMPRFCLFLVMSCPSPTLAPRPTCSSACRRRSPSFINVGVVPPSPVSDSQGLSPSTTDLVDPVQPTPSMLVLFVSRFFEWLHLHPKHPAAWSLPSSPRSSTEQSILPTSSQKSSFSDQVRPDIPTSHPPPPRRRLDFVLVRLFLTISRLLLTYLLRQDSLTLRPCYPALAHLNCFRSLLPLNTPDFLILAPHNIRCRAARQGTARLYPERTGSRSTRCRRHGCHCNMETCMVRPGKCHLGSSHFFISLQSSHPHIVECTGRSPVFSCLCYHSSHHTHHGRLRLCHIAFHASCTLPHSLFPSRP